MVLRAPSRKLVLSPVPDAQLARSGAVCLAAPGIAELLGIYLPRLLLTLYPSPPAVIKYMGVGGRRLSLPVQAGVGTAYWKRLLRRLWRNAQPFVLELEDESLVRVDPRRGRALLVQPGRTLNQQLGDVADACLRHGLSVEISLALRQDTFWRQA